MKLRTTLILVALTAALVAFIVIKERRVPGTREKMALQTRPFAFKAAAVDEIRLQRKDDALTLELKGGVWRIRKPFADVADPDLVKQVLETLPAMEWVESIKRGDLRRADYRRTGLEEDGVLLTVRGRGKTLAEVEIGAAAPLEGCFYARVPSEDQKAEEERDRIIRVARTTLPALLGKTDDDWRDPRLMRLNVETISRFAMNAGTGGMEFTRAPGQPWQLVKPFATRASSDRVNAVINTLINLKVKPAKVPAVGAAPRTPVPLTGPELPPMTITFEAAGHPKPFVITLDPSADATPEMRTQASHRDGMFIATSKISSGDFWRLQPNDLRDQNLVRIPRDQVTSLRIRSLVSPEIVLDKEDKTWMLTRFGKKVTAHQERVARLIDTLNSAQIREFLSDTAVGNLEPWGLHQPFLTIEWKEKEKEKQKEAAKAGTNAKAGASEKMENEKAPDGEAKSGSESESKSKSKSKSESENENSEVPAGTGKETTRQLQFGQGADGILTVRAADEPFIYRAHTGLLQAVPLDSLLWTTPKILNASIFAVRRITLAEGDRPSIALVYRADDATWTASTAGRDVTAQLDQARANTLLQKLVEFQAADWSSERAVAITALRNPSLIVQLVLGDPLNPAVEPRAVTLTFAPTEPGKDTIMYYGRMNEDPDCFVISREMYHELTTPVVK